MRPQNPRRFFFWLSGLGLAVLTGLFPGLLGAQIEVELTPPRLRPEWASLEVLLRGQTAVAAAEIELVLAGLLDKPRLLQALTDGLALSSAQSLSPALLRRWAALGVGAGASAQADTYDPAAWQERLDALAPEDDFVAGGAVWPLQAQVLINLKALVPGLVLGGRWAQARLDWEGSQLNSLGLGATLQWEAPWILGAPGGLHWRPLQLSASWQFGRQEFTTRLKTGPVVQYFEFRPSPFLPLRYNLAAEVVPEYDLRAAWEVQAWPLGLGTRFSFGDLAALEIMGLWLGVSGSSRVEVSGERPLRVWDRDSPEAGLIAEAFVSEGALALKGDTAGPPPQGQRWALSVQPVFRPGVLFLALPLAWAWEAADGSGQGFSAAVLVGLSL